MEFNKPMVKMITIIDYGSGNLKSIKNGFSRIGVKSHISREGRDLEKAQALVLPGVGAFGNAMESLQPYENIITEHIEDGKAFFRSLSGFTSVIQQKPGKQGCEGSECI